MKTYKYGEAEFTQKDFRQTKNRKNYYIQYGKLITLAVKYENNAFAIIAEMVFDDEGAKFDKFLECFVDGELTAITEAQKDIENETLLMALAVEVLTDFFTVSNNSIQS